MPKPNKTLLNDIYNILTSPVLDKKKLVIRFIEQAIREKKFDDIDALKYLIAEEDELEEDQQLYLLENYSTNLGSKFFSIFYKFAPFDLREAINLIESNVISSGPYKKIIPIAEVQEIITQANSSKVRRPPPAFTKPSYASVGTPEKKEKPPSPAIAAAPLLTEPPPMLTSSGRPSVSDVEYDFSYLKKYEYDDIQLAYIKHQIARYQKENHGLPENGFFPGTFFTNTDIIPTDKKHGIVSNHQGIFIVCDDGNSYRIQDERGIKHSLKLAYHIESKEWRCIQMPGATESATTTILTLLAEPPSLPTKIHASSPLAMVLFCGLQFAREARNQKICTEDIENVFTILKNFFNDDFIDMIDLSLESFFREKYNDLYEVPQGRLKKLLASIDDPRPSHRPNLSFFINSLLSIQETYLLTPHGQKVQEQYRQIQLTTSKITDPLVYAQRKWAFYKVQHPTIFWLFSTFMKWGKNDTIKGIITRLEELPYDDGPRPVLHEKRETAAKSVVSPAATPITSTPAGKSLTKKSEKKEENSPPPLPKPTESRNYIGSHQP